MNLHYTYTTYSIYQCIDSGTFMLNSYNLDIDHTYTSIFIWKEHAMHISRGMHRQGQV